MQDILLETIGFCSCKMPQSMLHHVIHIDEKYQKNLFLSLSLRCTGRSLMHEFSSARIVNELFVTGCVNALENTCSGLSLHSP